MNNENMENTDEIGKILPTHHIQQKLCTTRPLYRQGRKLTAVKVYTINNESQHLLVYRVPKVNLANELRAECMKFGELKTFEAVNKYKTEVFTECFHVQFIRIQSARVAKRFLDNKSFYGELLHVCYAPELETLSETRKKLLQREKDVLSRLTPGPTLSDYANVQVEKQQSRKRKYPALEITEKRLKTDNSDIWKGIPAELDPRTTDTVDSKTGFKKHFQIVTKQPRGVEYGPQLPDSMNLPQNVTQPDIIHTTLLPTTVIRKHEQNINKKIVFRNIKK